MTGLFVRVRSAEEATVVRAAGCDGTATEAAGRLVLAGPDGELCFDLHPDLLDAAGLDRALHAGCAGVVSTGAGVLIARSGIADCAAFRALCRSRGLLCGFGGDLQPPDIPRLLALDPDVLLLDTEVRLGREAAGPLDPAALRLVRELVPSHSGALRIPPGVPLGPDRIFLRDHVVSVAIGAYASERDRLQRVRFGVEADLRPLGRTTRDMRDVVSYDLFTDAIRTLTADRHVDFVETLAEEIADHVLRHPRILAVRVTVEKLDVGEGAVGVRIERGRAAA